MITIDCHLHLGMVGVVSFQCVLKLFHYFLHNMALLSTLSLFC